MYSFEGDFRRKPQQNLSGASAQRKTNRDALILQTQQQRQKREEHRKRLNSTVKIQAFVRSYLTRKHCKQSEREDFDNIFPKVNAEDVDMLCALVVKILFFYDGKLDSSRLVSVSQLLLKQWRKVFQNGGCYIQIRRLLVLHLRLLKEGSEVPLAVPLRMFEVFTSVNSAENSMNSDEVLSNVAGTFLYLVKRGYFTELRELLCRKTPPLYGPSPNPPTPLCGALLDLIQRPLNLTTHVHVSGYDNMVMSEFASAFLCNPYPEPVEMYIIPALSVDSRKFPFLALMQCLQDDTIFNKSVLNDSWLLHSVLSLEPPGFANEIRNINNTRLPNNPIVLDYLKIIAQLTVNVCNKQITYEYEDSLYSQETAADKDDDSDSETEPNPTSVREQMLLTRCIEILNEPDRCVMTTCSQITESDLSEDFLDCLSKICHNLLLSHRMALHKYRLLYTLAFKPIFLRGLWHWLSHMSHESSFGGSATPLLSALSRGMGAESTVIGVHRLLAPLAVFCALFSLLIGTLHDTEFCRDVDDDDSMSCESIYNNDSNVSHFPTGGGGRVHAFEFSELGGLCRMLRQVCLGLVELAYPESRPAVNTQYRDAVGATIELAGSQTPAWSHLFKVCTHLLRALYVRDSRLCFMPPGSWPVRGCVPEGAAAVLVVAGTHVRPNPRQLRRPQHHLHHVRDQDEGPPLTIKELRTVTILREIPFVVPFATRVLIFQGLLVREKHDHWYEMSNFNEGPSINISVRRTHLYEDAFDKLSPDNEPDMKLKLRVQLINQAGAEEAGVDGGGLFREFLSELLKSAFDPNRGLFRLTKDNMLYPNPGVHLLYDDFPMHYYFVGRMLGKALYENLLVELPLAEFFLGKLCSSREPDVHALASLDPALYRGLLMLKSHRRQDVPDLGLDFTIVSDELGEQRIEELKPGGANIPVTSENRIEYIHLVADYKLNRQIRSQCNAFKRGLTSVVNAEWLRMFSCRELQLLISGAEVPIDLEDLRAHTQYAGGFSATHPTVQWFWKVVENFADAQRRQLLKFVTSCSRPPLLGFKDLQPPFCIQSAGASDRLPSSSTCMNLLKLPEFHSEQQLHEKLLYAIQAGAGFELS
ncbi:ubiquitin-protein ligase E3C [Leguminivora glycinivorella]|uniref:ubiquitin-protein ligase E3C n=1 Tax=Leguminivora glycinivorella TaxID=1035111 RepID=UPI0020103E1C|nr:ubiquitin-protein ligase E3C [Leguminivora glycinivorella]